MKVVVLGGTGTLGRELVVRLQARGVETTAASRRTGVDLATGDGLLEALTGADAVIHAASDPVHAKRVDLRGTRKLLEALRRSERPAHVVYVSIVGCDANPYPYYRAKYACEEALMGGDGLPVTVVRATQFHSFVATVARSARPLGLGITVRGMAVQPIDVEWLAERLTVLATTAPPSGFTRHPDLAGPERLSFANGVVTLAKHDNLRVRRVITFPALGGTARAFAAGTHLPGPGADLGGRSFTDWLASQGHRQPTPRPGRGHPKRD